MTSLDGTAVGVIGREVAGPDELRHKLSRCREVLLRSGGTTADRSPRDRALVLESHGALSWLLDGARLDVGPGGSPIARAVVHADGVTLGVFAAELDRLRDEQLSPHLEQAYGLELVALDWHASLDPQTWWSGAGRAAQAPSGGAAAGATGRAGVLPASSGQVRLVRETELAPELAAARASLLPAERSRFRALCTDAAAVLTAELSEIRDELARVGPDALTERQVAAGIHRRTVDIGADPLVVLVAGESRLRHRHPVPGAAPLGRRVMVVLCARRDGMIANLTRWLGEPEHPATGRALLEVEADAFDALVPGTPLDAVLAATRAAYPRHGFAQDEWARHHQGGPAGYLGRDPRLSPGVPGLVVAQQAFALNPTGPGHKVEDTVLVAEPVDGRAVVEVLTTDGRWPTVDVRGRERPASLGLD